MDDPFHVEDSIAYPPSTRFLETVSEFERDVNAVQVLPARVDHRDIDRINDVTQVSVQTPPDFANSIVASQLQQFNPSGRLRSSTDNSPVVCLASSSNLNAQAEVFTPRSGGSRNDSSTFTCPPYNGPYGYQLGLGMAPWQDSIPSEAPLMAYQSYQPFMTPPSSSSSHQPMLSNDSPLKPRQRALELSARPQLGYITPQSSTSGVLSQDLVNMLPQELTYAADAHSDVNARNQLMSPCSQPKALRDHPEAPSYPTFQGFFQSQGAPSDLFRHQAIPRAAPTVADWNQSQYIPGDYTSIIVGTSQSVPPQPVVASRMRSRAGSRATSTSQSVGSHVCNFEGCGKPFMSKAELE